MADKLSELQEKRSKLAKEIGAQRDAFVANGDKWQDAEQEKRWSDINAAYNATVSEIEEVRKVAEIHTRAAQIKEDDERANYTPNPRTGRMPGQDDPAVRGGHKPAAPSEEERLEAMQAYCRAVSGRGVNEQEEELLRRCNYSSRSSEFLIQPNASMNTRFRRDLQAGWARGNNRSAMAEALECRTLSGVTLGSGGALIPETYIRTLEINMLAFGGVRQAADTITTSGGERMSWPTADDTSNTGEQLGESASIGSSVDPTFGAVYWDAYKFSSKPILVPYELMQDSAFALAIELARMQGERLGRITASKLTTGSGAATCKGIVTCATLGVTTTSATAFTWDDFIRLEHSVDPAYRNGAGYMMHDNIVLAARLLKDGEGRPLWTEGIGNSAPDRINGKPLYISQEMASSVASGNKTVLFGQLSSYKIRRAGAMRMYHLVERYRDNDQDAFVAFLREDGNLLTAGTSPVKYMTH